MENGESLQTNANTENIFSCSRCSETFLQEDALRCHESRHTKKHQYLCGECPKSFQLFNEISDHLQTDHSSGLEKREQTIHAHSTKIKVTRLEETKIDSTVFDLQNGSEQLAVLDDKINSAEDSRNGTETVHIDGVRVVDAQSECLQLPEIKPEQKESVGFVENRSDGKKTNVVVETKEQDLGISQSGGENESEVVRRSQRLTASVKTAHTGKNVQIRGSTKSVVVKIPLKKGAIVRKTSVVKVSPKKTKIVEENCVPKTLPRNTVIEMAMKSAKVKAPLKISAINPPSLKKTATISSLTKTALVKVHQTPVLKIAQMKTAILKQNRSVKRSLKKSVHNKNKTNGKLSPREPVNITTAFSINSTKMFVCDICGKKATELTHMKRHLPTHTTGKPFECKKCGVKVKRVDSLKRHYISVHQLSKQVVLSLLAEDC